MRMTREEAIKNIKEHCYFASLPPQAKEALDMAIKALEPCEDDCQYIVAPDDCEDFEETFEHHWEMMDDIEREEYNSYKAESEGEG